MLGHALRHGGIKNLFLSLSRLPEKRHRGLAVNLV